MSWLLDTLVWTGVLIAAVLLIRRPVARQFGAKAAYALWFLPLLRLALPPIVLPAWLAPAPPVAETMPASVAVAAVPMVSEPVASAAAFDWSALIGALWLAGAVGYIVLRLASYIRLRRELFRDARTVGQTGSIRLIETPATRSPLAFGVFSKVIALPPGFMAWTDRRARDLALSHELAHHRAHDLLFNFLALPLFALHWFNPLSLLGWRAMRRDQEAACDVRVVEHRGASDRAAYALLIASAVAGPRGALAAPMACPVLGDKSIVQRLRNLTMTTPSQNRRRLGAALVGASVLLVPLTGSISYAHDETLAPPLPPAAPPAPPAPDAPIAPEAPDAPAAPLSSAYAIPPVPDAPQPPAAPLPAAAVAPSAPAVVRVDQRSSDAQQRRREIRVTRIDHETRMDGRSLKELEGLAARLSHLGKEIEQSIVVPEIDVDRITAESRRAARVASAVAPHAAAGAARAAAVAPRATAVAVKCDSQEANGTRAASMCRRMATAHAVSGLRAARAQIARQRDMSEETRDTILDQLDDEIERLQATR